MTSKQIIPLNKKGAKPCILYASNVIGEKKNMYVYMCVIVYIYSYKSITFFIEREIVILGFFRKT